MGEVSPQKRQLKPNLVRDIFERESTNDLQEQHERKQSSKKLKF